MTISFFASGNPKAKGSKHGFLAGGHVVVTEGKSSKSWEATVRVHVAGLNLTRIAGPVSVVLDFFLPQPQTRMPKPKSKDYWKQHPVPDTKPDIDKLTRAVLDALSKICYEDDARIVRLVVNKTYSAVSPGVAVHISPMLKGER